MPAEREHLFDKPRNVRRLLYMLYSVCALLLGVEFLYHRHAVHPWDGWPGFYAGYGFFGCVLLVLVITSYSIHYTKLYEPGNRMRVLIHGKPDSTLSKARDDILP